MNKKPSNEVENVSEKLKHTKRDIEELKVQLGQILSSNIKPELPPSQIEHKEDATTKKKHLEIDNLKPSTSKPLINNHDSTRKKSPTPKPDQKDQCPLKKTRSYNVAEAREYMIKQKEKRAVNTKQTNAQENQLDLKKQKLRELQQKTRELVAKNVQLSRERSKSRNRNEQIRLDTARHTSQERYRQKSTERLPKPVNNFREKSKERSNIEKPKVSPRSDQVISKEKVPQTVTQPHRSRQRVREEKINELVVPPPPEVVVSPSTEVEKSSELNLPINNSEKGLETVKSQASSIIEPSKVIDRVETKIGDNKIRGCKETQTSEVNKLVQPPWLQPQASLPYPYNFINTVKRKLQFAINSPTSYVDVGIQSSVITSECKTPEPEQVKSKEEIRELLIKSTGSHKLSKSLIKKSSTHKPPNLDLRIVENLELKPKSNVDDVSKNLFTDYTSDSDTSKNIPDISSESAATKKTITEVSSKKLDLDSLKDLRLEPNKIKCPTTSFAEKSKSNSQKTESNGYPHEKVSYSSDFHKESEINSGRSATIRTETESNHNQFIEDSRKSSRGSKKSRTPSKEIKTVSNVPESEFDRFKKMITRRSDSDSQLSFHTLISGDGDTTSHRTKTEESALKSISEKIIPVDLSLVEPTVSLKVPTNENNQIVLHQQPLNNRKDNKQSNDIHSKFEAEVSLLNDFNESLRQFTKVEKAFENLKNQKENNITTKIFHNMDTQTSVITKTISTTRDSINQSIVSSINFSRGSDIMEELDVTNNKSNTTASIGWKMNNLENSTFNSTLSLDENKTNVSLANIENININSCAGLSLNMFDQLIKDEDTRIQQLRAIIKIREQALLDRTKSELVWLEIQKKQLIQTGKVEEASLLKKKQRGILLKHEQERNEIKKLKQLQKSASEERKNILKQQRNLIKSQLSSSTMLSKIKLSTPRERRNSGPLRVVQSCSESIRSETSISRKNSEAEDVLSVCSKSLSIRMSEDSDLEISAKKEETKLPVSSVKRTLLMREVALQKRRKAAEELLQWHRKLLDEEKKIAELEAAAQSVINRIPKSEPKLDKYKFSGKQLNQLWKNITGHDDRKFVEEKIYIMSQITLERFCKSASQFGRTKKTRTSELPTDHSVISENSEESAVKSNKISQQSGKDGRSEDASSYTSLFEPESVQEVSNLEEDKTKIISELINNFSKIEDEISLLSKTSERDIPSFKESSEIPEEEEENFEQVSSSSPSQCSVETKISSKVMTPKELDVKESVSLEIKEVSDGTSQNVEEIISRDSVLSDKEVQSLVIEEKDECDNTESEDVPEEIKEVESKNETQEIKEDIAQVDSKFSESVIIIEEEGEAQETMVESTKIEEESSGKKTETVLNTLESENKTISSAPSVEIVEESEKVQEESVEEVDEEIIEKSMVDEEKTKSNTSSPETAISEQSLETNQLNESGQDIITVSEINEKSKETSIHSEKEVVSQEKVSTSVEEISEKSIHLEKDSVTEEDKVSTPPEDISEKSIQSAKETVSQEDEASTSPEEESKAEESNKSSKKSTISEEDLKSEEKAIDSGSTPKSSEYEKEVKSMDEALQAASKIEESLSKLNDQLASDKTEVSEELKTSSSKQETSIVEEEKDSTSKSSEEIQSELSNKSSSESSEKTPSKKNQIDVKKRVSEILDASSPNRGDKSPRLQDLYVTTYDILSTTDLNEDKSASSNIFGSEAEELWKKQLAIEQEIKQLEQQQKEQLPYVFMREIPNKPPPPYTPPSSLSSIPLSILPSDPKEINELTNYCSKVIYKAYQNKNLEKVKFSENSFKLCSKIDLAKQCGEFMFNICRDIAREHYKQFEVVEEPAWLMLSKPQHLAVKKPFDVNGLERYMNRKLKELFGFVKVQVTESANIKWGRKKRDHVDEILVVESQEEESQWTNFDKDELLVKDHITNDIMKMLLDETASVFSKILSKKNSIVG